jgi:hypothetical protein
MALIDDDFWPASLVHLTDPYLSDSSQYVTIGEISSEPVSDFPGTRLLYTAMAPENEANECLARLGGMGHGIRHLKGQQVYDPAGGNPSAAFWVESMRPDHKRYQALVESWQVHDRYILLPFNGILQHYGLSPTVLSDQTGPIMAWHDLSTPTYDVVRVIPLSVYQVPKQTSAARVEILREYLEDYLLANDCVALATQWEGRHSTGDPAFDSVVGERKGLSAKLRGREIWLKRVEHIADGDQYSDTWCTRLVMKPVKALDSDQKLEWPDHNGPIVGSGIMGGFGVMEEAYVRDEVLLAYENRPEFDIHPETGMVGHGGWWSVAFCRRVGREHIALELRKLYEGAQFPVIKHYCGYAVKKSSLPVPKNDDEKRNIGIRAREVVDQYLALIATLEKILDAAGLPFAAEDIGGLSQADIKHRGWWTFPMLGRLGNVAPLSMTYQLFLARCKDIFGVFEGLKSAPLRALLLKLQVPKDTVKTLEGLKLCAFLCQLATIAKNEGWALIGDADLVIKKWDSDTRLDFYKPLFALNGLRMADAHASSSVRDPKAQALNLKAFGIDPDKFKTGWGLALDRVYDEIARSLQDVTTLLQSVQLSD